MLFFLCFERLIIFIVEDASQLEMTRLFEYGFFCVSDFRDACDGGRVELFFEPFTVFIDIVFEKLCELYSMHSFDVGLVGFGQFAFVDLIHEDGLIFFDFHVRFNYKN